MKRGPASVQDHEAEELLELLAGKPIVLVGMMGAGKTTVGRRLATRLGWDFMDSDAEIEKAAGMDIPDIFAAHGEPEFRAGEQRVIARILQSKNLVLGTGGGAFINPETRDLINAETVSVWINADFELLFQRVSRRANRPLLQTENPRATLQKLIDVRYPVYAKAHVTITSRDVPHEVVAADVIAKITQYLKTQTATAGNE